MTVHEEKAIKLFVSGYNCAQSVFAAFSDITGIDEETSLKMSSSLGAGIGHLRLTCGTISAMAMVIGILYGYSTPNDPEAKKEHYARMRMLTDRFKEVYPTLWCAELVKLATRPVALDGDPEPRTPEYYTARPCVKLVALSARIIDEYIDEQNEK